MYKKLEREQELRIYKDRGVLERIAQVFDNKSVHISYVFKTLYGIIEDVEHQFYSRSTRSEKYAAEMQQIAVSRILQALRNVVQKDHFEHDFEVVDAAQCQE